MTDTQPLPRHTRPVPPEWDILLTYAERLPSVGRSSEQAQMVYQVANLLQDDELDEARYYGFGTALCLLAQDLANPAIRGGVVRASAQNLASAAARREFPLTIGLMGHASIAEPFIDQAAEVCGRLEPATWLCVDALNQVAMHRQTQRNDEPDPEQSVPEVLGGASVGGPAQAIKATLFHKQPLSDAFPRPLHYERLKCPALQIEGLAVLGLDIMLEIASQTIVLLDADREA